MSRITGIATAGNGQEMYAGRVPAWDGLGQSTAGIMAADIEKAMDAANVNITFHYSPVFDEFGNEIPKSRAVYRTVQGGPDDGTVIHSGIVGDRHHQLQPRELAEVAREVDPEASVEALGMLKNSRFWIQLSGDKEFTIDPTGVADRVLNFKTFSTTMDGSGSLLIGDTNFRWNCQNVITSSIRGTAWEYKIRHTASMAARIAQAVKAIRAAKAHRELFVTVANDLFVAPFSDRQFENAVTTLHGKRPEDNVKGRETKWENMMGNHFALWNAEHNAGIRNTAWGAWNVLLESNQWNRNVQDTDNGPANFWAAGMGFDGPTNTFRRDALALVGQRAGVLV